MTLQRRYLKVRLLEINPFLIFSVSLVEICISFENFLGFFLALTGTLYVKFTIILILVFMNQLGRYRVGKKFERFCLSPCSHPINQKITFQKTNLVTNDLVFQVSWKEEVLFVRKCIGQDNRLCPNLQPPDQCPTTGDPWAGFQE